MALLLLATVFCTSAPSAQGACEPIEPGSDLDDVCQQVLGDPCDPLRDVPPAHETCVAAYDDPCGPVAALPDVYAECVAVLEDPCRFLNGINGTAEAHPFNSTIQDTCAGAYNCARTSPDAQAAADCLITVVDPGGGMVSFGFSPEILPMIDLVPEFGNDRLIVRVPLAHALGLTGHFFACATFNSAESCPDAALVYT